MELSDFENGKTYLVTEYPFAPPDGSSTVPGNRRTVKILSPATNENSAIFNGETSEAATITEVNNWRDFLRVENMESNRIHLLHPGTIETAVMV